MSALVRVTVAAAVGLCACKHEPQKAAPAEDVVAGQLMVGADAGVSPEALVRALALDGYRFEYVAAASETTHLVKAAPVEGPALSAEATAALAKKLEGRPGLKYVELNRVRQMR